MRAYRGINAAIVPDVDVRHALLELDIFARAVDAAMRKIQQGQVPDGSGDTFGGGVFDHGLLEGLGNDDHAQYALLAGRAGGQTLVGGASGSDALVLSGRPSGVGKVYFGSTSSNFYADHSNNVLNINYASAGASLTVKSSDTSSTRPLLDLIPLAACTQPFLINGPDGNGSVSVNNSLRTTIFTDSDDYTLIVKAYASQTQHLQLWQGTAGSTVAHVDVSGNADFTGLTLDNALVIAEGGTGSTTAQDARIALLPTKTGQSLKFLRVNSGETDFEWATVSGGSLTVQENDSTVDAAVTTLDFGSAFDVSSSPSGEANISLDLTEYGGGALPIAGGGTGQTGQTAAFDALAPTTTKGDLIASNGTDNVRLAVGTDGYALKSDSAAAAGVSWDRAWTIVPKTADQAKTSDSTLGDDDTLKFTVVSGGIYAFRFFVYYSTNTTPDFKFSITGPALGSASVHHKALGPGITAYSNIAILAGLPGSTSVAGGTGTGMVELFGRVDVDADGTIVFCWAQNTSNAAATTVLAGSYLEWIKVA